MRPRHRLMLRSLAPAFRTLRQCPRVNSQRPDSAGDGSRVCVRSPVRTYVRAVLRVRADGANKRYLDMSGHVPWRSTVRSPVVNTAINEEYASSAQQKAGVQLQAIVSEVVVPQVWRWAGAAG